MMMSVTRNPCVLVVALALVLVVAETEANVAIGRSGSMRPGKRSLALGRFNLRPGKRSFRDTLSNLEGHTCNTEDVMQVTELLEYMVPFMEEYVTYLERCTQGLIK